MAADVTLTAVQLTVQHPTAVTFNVLPVSATISYMGAIGGRPTDRPFNGYLYPRGNRGI